MKKLLLSLALGLVVVIPTSVFAFSFDPTEPTTEDSITATPTVSGWQIWVQILPGNTTVFSEVCSPTCIVPPLDAGHYLIFEFDGGSVYNTTEFDVIEAGEPVLGCTDPEAENYDPEATEDDGSCTYPPGEPGSPSQAIGDQMKTLCWLLVLFGIMFSGTYFVTRRFI